MYRRILIPTDGSPCSDVAIDSGIAFAAELGAGVTFLHAVEAPLELAAEAAPYAAEMYSDLLANGEALLREAEDRASDRGVEADVLLVERTRAPRAILDVEDRYDLIVMGTHGRRGFNRWMFGSVAEEVLRRSTTPCLLIPSHEKGLGEALRDELEATAEDKLNGELDEGLEETFPASDPVAVHPKDPDVSNR